MTTPDIWIDRAGPGDEAAIEQLLDVCFGADRLTKTSYRYRDAVARSRSAARSRRRCCSDPWRSPLPIVAAASRPP